MCAWKLPRSVKDTWLHLAEASVEAKGASSCPVKRWTSLLKNRRHLMRHSCRDLFF